MLTRDHLFLQTGRLTSGEQWNLKGEGWFFFFPAGPGRCLSPKATQAFSRDDVVVLNPASFDKVSADHNGDLEFKYFTLSFEHLLPLFAAKEMGLLNNIREVLKGSRLYPASSPLAAECRRLLKDVPVELELDHRGQLLRIVTSILTSELKQAHTQRVALGNGLEHITQVFEKLSITEIYSMSVDELAAKFGCSARHLNRLFHQYFGFSVAALRMELRMLKAVSLLREPDTKILDIADQCGFNYLSLFNDCFKKRFGMTPGQWRKSHSSDSAEYQLPLLGDGGIGCPIRINGLCPWAGTPVDGPAACPAPKGKSKRAAGPAVSDRLPLPSLNTPKALLNVCVKDQSGPRIAPRA